MPTRLVSLCGGPDIRIEGFPVLVGRHPECDARINLLAVSRRHCRLAEQGGDIMVYDLGSSNGTRVNGRRIESERVAPGDVLAIGPLCYRVESMPAP